MKNNIALIGRGFGYLMLSALFLYLINNYLVYWQDMPGPFVLFSHYGWFGFEALSNQLDDSQVSQGWIQFTTYLVVLLISIGYVIKTRARTLEQESIRFTTLSAFIVRFSFWSVLLIGLADMVISLLRVENLLEHVASETLTQQLGRPIFRGSYVHYPLVIASMFIAARFRNATFAWLALLVVIAEFMIVISRFVFSYEQAYMGDLVRFWYAALFLFASAHTLVEEGHVRVDVLYTGFSRRKKALFDSIGCLLFGIPICWVILMHGMGGRGNSINSPLLSFEVTQSGYGMYVKYIMAAFLIVFSVTMMIQFVSFLLYNIAQLINRSENEDHLSYHQLVTGDRTAASGGH
ncbi:MAG: TRAP transporter small permease subunit [Gammaproteobacteria bacterium]|nr:TRAP transporter small permease subunit [Gammaproteobacteria bacterium]MDH3536572.1 TRAP transporter small permease subunit [Gammaproteobacteria bacterium]